MAKLGRPAKLTQFMESKIPDLMQKGATPQQLAEIFEVHDTTVNRWLRKNPNLRFNCKIKKWERNREVEDALQMSATGYDKEITRKAYDKETGEVKEWEETVYYPPVPTAGIFLLKAREKWRDRWDETNITVPVQVVFNTPRPDHVIEVPGDEDKSV